METNIERRKKSGEERGKKNVKEEGKKKKKRKRKKEESQWRPVLKEERKVEKKGGKMVKSCGCRFLHVCLFTKMPLSYELWKQSYVNRIIV